MRQVSIFFLSGYLLLSCSAEAVFQQDSEKLAFLFGLLRMGRVVDSGQLQCTDDSGITINCDDASFPGQDAAYVGVPKPRAIAWPAVTADGGLVTIDHGTGLIWTTCPIDSTGAPDSTPTCIGAAASVDSATAASYCSALNSRRYGGYSDWRLASVRELRSLLEHSTTGIYYDTAAFPGSAAATFVASTTIAFANFFVDFSTTSVALGGGSGSVRCVAGPPLQTGVFRVLDNGMVREENTGLVFLRCGAGQSEAANCAGTAQTMTWQQALQYCHNLVHGGRRWRLPAIQELEMLIRFDKYPPYDTTAFPNASGMWWTSTSDATGLASAVVIDLAGGGEYYSFNKGNLAPVRCVSGP